MSSPERMRIHEELLEALYETRKRLDSLETALAQNAALLGAGVELPSRIGTPPPGGGGGDVLTRYYELVEKEDDISDYIGREGHEESRPRLGEDAPRHIRPNKAPEVSHLVGQLAIAHPDDSISFAPSAAPLLEEKLSPYSAEDSPEAEASALRLHLAATTAARVRDRAEHLPPGEIDTVSPELAPSLEPAHTDQPVPEVFLRSFLAMQAINDGVWDWNIETGKVYWSKRWQEILHCTGQAGAIGKHSPLDELLHCLHPADAETLHSRMQGLMAGNIGRLRMAVRIKREPDSWAWGMLRAVCLRSENAPLRITAALADITAQREAELALRASEEKFRALAEDSPDFISRFDSHGLFLYASPNISRYLPVTPGEVIGKPLSAFNIGGEVGFFEENLTRVLEMGLPIQAEAHLTSPLVGAFVADCRFWPEFGEDGEVVSVTTQVRDMTLSRRMAENYQALFNSMVDGFALFEHIPGWEKEFPSYEAGEFALIAMNPSLGRMLGTDASSAIGFRLLDLMGEDSAQWAACLRKVLVEERPLLYSLRSKERSGMFQISAYSPEERRVACIVKDVTDLHSIEQEMRLNEARFAALYRLSHMDAAPEEEVARFSLDQAVRLTCSGIGYLFMAHRYEGDPGCIYWSSEVLQEYGETPLPPQICDLPPARSSGGACFDAVRAEVVNDPAGSTAAFGSSLSVNRYMLAPVIEDGRVVCMAAVANKEQLYEASDLRQLELFINGMWFQLRRRWAVQVLQKAKDEAEAASRAKNEFLANVSHELRTPLNGILGMLQLLQQSSLTAEQLECVVTANYSGRSLLRIISDILDFSRIEAGRFELASQIFDFAATVRSTLGMFIHQAEQKKIDFALHMGDNIPRTLLGDDARVRQIIFNLVGNAFKFTEKGEITVECSLLPRCWKGKQCIYLAVHDTGIGIPDEKLDDIFHAFTQLDGSSTRRYAGTGLGLGIVQRLVQLMGGTVSIESVLGKGTSVYCSLPFEPAEDRRSNESARTAPETPLPLDILVAEDDPINQLTIRSMLKKTGHLVQCVNDGRQALEALMLHSFDCLITDIQMPVMDGVELVSRIRSGNNADVEPSAFVGKLIGQDVSSAVLQPIPQDLPIIALTAHAMTGDRERFLSLGMDHYLAKPIIASELAAVLQHVATILYSRHA